MIRELTCSILAAEPLLPPINIIFCVQKESVSKEKHCIEREKRHVFFELVKWKQYLIISYVMSFRALHCLSHVMLSAERELRRSHRP